MPNCRGEGLIVFYGILRCRLHGKVVCSNYEWYSRTITQRRHPNASSSPHCSTRMCIPQVPSACRSSTKRKIGDLRLPLNKSYLEYWTCLMNLTSRILLRLKRTRFTGKQSSPLSWSVIIMEMGDSWFLLLCLVKIVWSMKNVSEHKRR
jgi:hypothetical protein